MYIVCTKCGKKKSVRKDWTYNLCYSCYEEEQELKNINETIVLDDTSEDKSFITVRAKFFFYDMYGNPWTSYKDMAKSSPNFRHEESFTEEEWNDRWDLHQMVRKGRLEVV